MHILFYISRFGVGGIQTFVIQLAKELVEIDGVKISIFCHHPEQADTSNNEPIPDNIEIITLSKNKYKIILINKLRNWIKKWSNFDLKEWLTTRFFLKILQEKKISLVHNNIEIGDKNCFLANKNLGIPYLTTLHGAYKEITENISASEKKAQQDIFEKLLATVSTIVYLSSANLLPFKIVLGDFSTKQQQQFIRIFNGLKAPVLPPSTKSTNKIVFGLVARGVPSKGWEEAILATIALVQKNSTAKIELQLYGASEHLDELQKKYEAYKNFVLFCGVTDKPLEVVREFTVGLLPTYLPQEEMPFTIIEYLACGVPVIATNKGAIPEMLDAQGQIAGEIIGFDQNSRADVVQLQQAMQKFIEDSSYLQNKAALANIAFQKFNIKHTVEQYYHLYQKALKK